MKLDPGYSAGLLSGALTESPAIGTASEAIRGLSVPDDRKQQWIGHVAVADCTICYIFGTLGVILVCGSFGPKLLRIDLRAESRKVEERLGIKHSKLGVSSAWQPIGYRAYKIRPDGRLITLERLSRAEKVVPAARLFVERIRRSGENFQYALPTTVLEAGDTVAVLGRTEALINLLSSSSVEATDPELLEIPVASYGLYVTNRMIAGKTLHEFVESTDEARGVFLRGITRSGQKSPTG